MCRVLAYLGSPVLLESFLYQPDSSLIRQAYEPKMLELLSLAGFGMVAWDPASYDVATPFEYRTAAMPLFDPNLRSLARKLRPSSMLAHVRGVPYDRDGIVVGPHNLHPFRFPGFHVALAHNGELARFDEMKFDLLRAMRPEIARLIQGTTDSEWIYALIMSQIADPQRDLDAEEIAAAVRSALVIIREARAAHGIEDSSAVNLFLCDSNDIVATRFTFDFGRFAERPRHGGLDYLSLWYTFGRDYGLHDGEWKMRGGLDDYDSILVASEPLTRDASTWLEVPEYSMLFLSRKDGERRVEIMPLDA